MKILFVCLGNICRSPLAEGLLKDKVGRAGLTDSIYVESAGFEPFHRGDSPDSRALRVAENHGIDISHHLARLFRKEDFDRFDRLYVMDRNNYRDVMKTARSEEDKNKVDYILNLLYPGSNKPVADPWYGGMKDFELTFSQLDQATALLLKDIRKETGL